MKSESRNEETRVHAVAQLDPIYQVDPSRVWIRITNCETPGRFKIILEVTDRSGKQHDKMLYEAVDEHDGNISQANNLSWLIKRRPEGTTRPVTEETCTKE